MALWNAKSCSSTFGSALVGSASRCLRCVVDVCVEICVELSFVELSCSPKCNPTVFRPGALAEFPVVALRGPTFCDSLKGLFCSQRFVSYSRVHLGLVYLSHGVWKLG